MVRSSSNLPTDVPLPRHSGGIRGSFMPPPLKESISDLSRVAKGCIGLFLTKTSPSKASSPDAHPVRVPDPCKGGWRLVVTVPPEHSIISLYGHDGDFISLWRAGLVAGQLLEYLGTLAAFPTILTGFASIPLLSCADYLATLHRYELEGLDARRGPVPPERFYWTLHKAQLRRALAWSGPAAVATWAAAVRWPAASGSARSCRSGPGCAAGAPAAAAAARRASPCRTPPAGTQQPKSAPSGSSFNHRKRLL